MRREFLRFEPNFENTIAMGLIGTQRYPELFEYCRNLDKQRYFRCLASLFAPRPMTPLYQAFVKQLSKISPLQILTTNVDESLEHNISSATLVQSSDISRGIDLLNSNLPFILKLHGSLSAIESVVFCQSDYQALLSSEAYLQTLRTIFSTCCVVFLGYGMGDQYVVDLLAHNAKTSSLFGTEIHFVVSNDASPLPTNVHRIGYITSRHRDHRASATVLDVIHQSLPKRSSLVDFASPSRDEVNPTRTASAYYISDFSPPGTWRTSETATVGNRAGEKAEITVGLGFTDDEIPSSPSTAAHDLAVGILCFDEVFLPTTSIDRAVTLLGDRIKDLLKEDAIGFVHFLDQPSTVFDEGSLMGSLSLIRIAKAGSGEPESAEQLIRRFVVPTPGSETEGEKFYQNVMRKTLTYTKARDVDLPGIVRGSLLLPKISELLGIGEAILPSTVPKWLRFGYLRLAQLVSTSAVCNEFGFRAAKLPFGGPQLTTAAFGSEAPREVADSIASYVYTGSFNSDLGRFMLSDPNIFGQMLRFRNTPEGESIRREVKSCLAETNGDRFNTAVNAALTKAIPTSVLQKARDRMSTLLTTSARSAVVAAVWSNASQPDDYTKYWRRKALRNLLEYCSQRGVHKNDACPCGSGDELRLCCLPPLET
jgi:hypothetical protein